MESLTFVDGDLELTVERDGEHVQFAISPKDKAWKFSVNVGTTPAENISKLLRKLSADIKDGPVRTISINGERHQITAGYISYEKICELAGLKPDHNPTIVFAKGLDPIEGELTHKQSILIRSGMIFTAMVTGNA